MKSVGAVRFHRLPELIQCGLLWGFHQIIPGKIKHENKATCFVILFGRCVLSAEKCRREPQIGTH